VEKSAPSVGRIAVAIAFALSCFGLLLYLWIVFGGPVPLKSSSYRVTAYFPEAAQIAQESDVRIGGVSVGKVKEISLAPMDMRVNGQDTTEAVIEIDPKFAPISADARAMLRQKTLLGETYVELTAGTEPPEGTASEDAPALVSLGETTQAAGIDTSAMEAIPEGGTLGVGQTREATQIDEIFNALDEETRTSFQRWQASAAVAIKDRGLDFNDALGNLGPFLTDASDVVDILERQKVALKGVVRDTGTTFKALNSRNEEFAQMITGTRNTFEALASEEEALAETFEVLPTFQRESRATFERLDEFQRETTPFVELMIPVARDLSPTLGSVRRLAPNLRDFFVKFDELEKASERGLPALRRFLDGFAPAIDALDPFLSNLNPIIRYLEFQKETVADFLAGPAGGLSGVIDGLPGDPAPRHVLRVMTYLGQEALAIWPNRLATNRGNAYKGPDTLNDAASSEGGIFPQFDCKNTDYTPTERPQDEDVVTKDERTPGLAACWTQGDFPASPFGDFGDGRAPNVTQDP
jgi:phospholipid/cholesterol/gamma-HCH transport system substrate-binding protein